MSSTPSPFTASDDELPSISVERADFTPALVVIDMQNDFVSGSLAVPDAADILPVVNRLIGLPFRVKFATKDFHPDSHISFAQTHGKSEFSSVDTFHPEDEDKLTAASQILWPVHCVADTSGAEFVPGLQQQFDGVVCKGTHPSIESYSAFRDIWRRSETELPQLLAEAGATDVYFCGLAGDYCVKYSALDSVEYGYNTWVIKDAVKSVSSGTVAWDEMERKGVKFTNYQDVRNKLQP